MSSQIKLVPLGDIYCDAMENAINDILKIQTCDIKSVSIIDVKEFPHAAITYSGTWREFFVAQKHDKD